MSTWKPRRLERPTRASHRVRRERGPRQALGTEHEQRDDVQPPLEDERGGLAVDEVGDGATLQRELIVAGEGGDRRKVESPREPRLDLMDAAALNLDGVIAIENAQMVVHRLGEH